MNIIHRLWNRSHASASLIFWFITPLLGLFISGMLYSYESRIAEVQDDLAERGLVVSRSMAESGEYGLASGNFADLERMANSLVLADKTVSEIDILTANKQVVVHVAQEIKRHAEDRVFEVPVRRPILPVDDFRFDGSPDHQAVEPPDQSTKATIVGYIRVRMSSTELLSKQTKRFFVQLGAQLLFLLASTVCAIYFAVRSNHQLENEVRERTNELVKANAEKRKLIHRVNSIVEDERKAIAVEIHDELNATLLAMKFDLRNILSLTQTTETGDVLLEINRNAQAALDTTSSLYKRGRDIVNRLRPEVLDILGLQGAIEDIVALYNKANSGCQFELQVRGDFSKLENDLSIAAYRIIQESLSNTIKHAHATQVAIVMLLRKGEKTMEISISDNGIGFDPKTITPGIGLIGIDERVHSFKGRIDIQTNIGVGTKIVIELPNFFQRRSSR